MTPVTKRRPVETVDIVVGETDVEGVRKVEDALRPLLNHVQVMSEGEKLRDYLLDAADGKEGRVPDLVIVDRELLGKECWEFIEEFQKRQPFRRTLIAIMTDKKDKKILDRAMKAGVDWFVPKPLTIANLTYLIDDMDHLNMAVVRVKTEDE